MFALCIFAMIAFLAIVIDLTMAYIAKEQARHACEYASLAAAQGYMTAPITGAMPPSVQYQTRIGPATPRAINALDRANDILRLNQVSALPVAGAVASLDALGYDAVVTPNSVLTPGQWFFGPTAALNCGADPCFKPNSVADTIATAFNCNVSIPSGFRTLLGAVAPIGQSTINVAATATAKFLPIDMMFLVDLSQSTTYGTHFPYKPMDPRIPANAKQQNCPTTPAFDYAADYIVPLFQGIISPSTNIPLFVNAYKELPDDRLGLATDEFVHYESDFTVVRFNGATAAECSTYHPAVGGQAFTTPTPALPVPPLPKACFLIDRHTSSVPNCQYQGPQPITDIFSSVVTALRTMRGRSINTDRAGLLGFDQRDIGIDFSSPTVPRIPSNGPFLRSFPLTDPLTLLAATDTSVDADILLKQYLFPVPTYGTDIIRSLAIAFNEFNNNANPVTAARRSVVLYSDGVATCSYDSIGQDGSDNIILGVQTCRDNKDPLWKETVAQAQIQLIQIANFYLNADIRIHSVSVGPWVQPETKNIQRPEYTSCCDMKGVTPSNNLPNVCHPECASVPRWITPNEAIQSNNSGYVTYPSPQPYFDEVNQAPNAASTTYNGPVWTMYELARITKGGFYPLRPTPDSSCIQSNSESKCASDISTPDRTEGTRQLTDPYGRAQLQQMQQYLRDIVGSEGLILAE